MLHLSKKIILNTLFAFFFLGSTVALAQTPQTMGGLSTFPKYPRPNELVTVHLNDYSINLNATEVTWSLDGKIQKKGIGEKQFQFTAGAIGKKSVVKASTNTYTLTLNINPVGLDIFWQTQTYTPPFYKGKALFSYQSAVDFVALPVFLNSSGVLIDPKTLIYTWSKNNAVAGNLSGYGKNSISLVGGVLAKPMTIGVKVSSIDDTLESETEISLTANSPQTILYENHPLYGITYNKSLPYQLSLDEKEITLSVAPYFFDVNRKDKPTISYVWKMNGKEIQNLEKPFSLVLRKPEGGGAGSAILSLLITQTEKMFQFANSSISIFFKSEEETQTNI